MIIAAGKDGLLPVIIAAGKDRALYIVIINRCTKMLLANNDFRMQEKTVHLLPFAEDNRWR